MQQRKHETMQKKKAKRFRATTIDISKFEPEIFLRASLYFSLIWLHFDLIIDKIYRDQYKKREKFIKQFGCTNIFLLGKLYNVHI